MVTVKGDGSIGPVPNPDGAARWLTERLEMLCRLTGQNGTPDAWIVPVDTSGHECVCPAVYDSSTDTIRIHYTPTEDDIFDVAAVDGMLLHALGHRHRRARTRACRWFGWALAVAGIAVASATALREDVPPPLLAALAALTGLGLLHIGLLVRFHWTAEASADDYALDHGGPRPILTFLRRMVDDPVSESALPLARPGRRISRIQTQLWAGSTLNTVEPSLPPDRCPSLHTAQPVISRGTLTLCGVLDLCVLALVAEAPLYGYELRDRLADRGISISNGTTYALLARMKSAGHVTQD